MLLRIAVLGVSAALLGGCLPPVLQVASWTISGASYVFSGKSVGDHVLSLAADQDCATWRVLQGKRICVDHEKKYENGWEAVASTFKVPAADQPGTSPDVDSETGDVFAETTAQPVEQPVQLATVNVNEVALGFEDEASLGVEAAVQDDVQDAAVTLEAPKASPRHMISPVELASSDDVADLAPASGPSVESLVEPELTVVTPQEKITTEKSMVATPRREAGKPLVTYAQAERRVDEKPGIYLVIGSFRSNNRAEKLQSKHTATETTIMKASVSGRSLFRVLAGPIERPGLASARKVLSKAGVRNSWAMRLCKATLTPPPCATPLQQAALPK